MSLHSAAVDIKTAKGNKYVIVGLPCHIEGFRKLEAVDRKFKEKIAGYFAIYCSSGRTFYLTEYVFNKLNMQKEELIYLAYRDEGCLGSLVAKTRNGKKYKEKYQSYYHPLRSFLFHVVACYVLTTTVSSAMSALAIYILNLIWKTKSE